MLFRSGIWGGRASGSPVIASQKDWGLTSTSIKQQSYPPPPFANTISSASCPSFAQSTWYRPVCPSCLTKIVRLIWLSSTTRILSGPEPELRNVTAYEGGRAMRRKGGEGEGESRGAELAVMKPRKQEPTKGVDTTSIRPPCSSQRSADERRGVRGCKRVGAGARTASDPKTETRAAHGYVGQRCGLHEPLKDSLTLFECHARASVRLATIFVNDVAPIGERGDSRPQNRRRADHLSEACSHRTVWAAQATSLPTARTTRPRPTA